MHLLLVAALAFPGALPHHRQHHWPYPACHRSIDCIVREARDRCVEGDAPHCRIWHRSTHALRALFVSNHTPYKPPDPPPAMSVSTAVSDNNLADVPGVPPAFAACVALRESTDGAGSSDIYGILEMNGYYPGMPLAAQKALFASMYAAQGPGPWAPWDGC